MPTPKVGTVDIDLYDMRMLGIELPPSKIAPEKNEDVAVGHCVEAGACAKDAGHANVKGIFEFQKIRGPGCMCHRRLQGLTKAYDLVTRIGAARSGIHRNAPSFVE